MDMHESVEPQQSVSVLHALQIDAHLAVVEVEVADEVTHIECPWNCWEHVMLSQQEVLESHEPKEVTQESLSGSVAKLDVKEVDVLVEDVDEDASVRELDELLSPAGFLGQQNTGKSAWWLLHWNL